MLKIKNLNILEKILKYFLPERRVILSEETLSQATWTPDFKPDVIDKVCLEYILNNAELFAEWVNEGKIPRQFLLTMPGHITPEDIDWGQSVSAERKK